MTKPVKVNGPKVEAYLTTAYSHLQKIVTARAALQAAAGQASGEAPPIVFSGGSSALGATAAPIIAALDSTAASLQAGITAAGGHKDAQEKLSKEAREKFCEVPSDDIEKPLGGGGAGAGAGAGKDKGQDVPSGVLPGGVSPWGGGGSPWGGGGSPWGSDGGGSGGGTSVCP